MKQNRKKIDWQKPRLDIVETLILTICLTALSALITMWVITNHYHKEACKRGYAKWEVVSQSDGSTKFVWIENALDKSPSL